MNASAQRVQALADGQASSYEIACRLGLSPRYVRRLMRQHGMPQMPVGPPRGERNPSYRGGRSVDLDGYVLVSAPPDHPHRRRIGRMLEHRLVVERALGRYLEPREVVDHIDGLTLHNDPSNLRVFASNGDHLRGTISGTPRLWSKRGHQNIGTRADRGRAYQPVDSYRLSKESGDVRLRAILRAALQLGTDSPHLSGTLHYLEQAGIDPASRPNLERALRDVESRFDAIRAL